MATPPPRRSAPSPPQPSSKFKPRSFEDQVRFAYHTPTPGTYDPKHPGQKSQRTLGKISEAKIPSALDHGQREKTHVPGPGSYETPELRDMSLPEGGRMSRKPPEEKFRIDEYPKPAPGEYGIPADPTLPRQLYGSFGKDPRVTKFIDDQIKLSKGVPAPGAHEVMDSMESMKPFCPEGGRYLEQVGRARSYWDGVAKQATGGPDPGRYDLPGAINPQKAAGKLVWKYQSETLAQTKKVITKVVGNGNETPAPGTYTLPDPKPIAPSPTITGRSLSHGMPHPYAYNCAPDHSGKYDSLSSALSKNSRDQIYGNDFTSPNINKKDRAARAAAAADQVVAGHMPVTLAEREIDQPGETVQWRSGGFASLRKVKSVPVIVGEHMAVEETRKRYPAMARKNGRKDTSFAPWAHRRPEIVRTSSKSDDYIHLQRKRWQFEQLTKDLLASASTVTEPLDEDKLKEEATRGLIDKAKFRMQLEGLAQDQQDLVLAEFPGVMKECQPGNRGAGEDSFAELFGGEYDDEGDDLGDDEFR